MLSRRQRSRHHGPALAAPCGPRIARVLRRANLGAKPPGWSANRKLTHHATKKGGQPKEAARLCARATLWARGLSRLVYLPEVDADAAVCCVFAFGMLTYPL